MLAGVLTREKKMKNRLLVYVVLALALSGCTTLKWVPRFEERRTPQVTVSEGRIVVTPEILFYFQDERDFIITFQLPKESGLTFPAKEAVVIEGELTDALIRSGDRVGVVLNRDQKEILDPDLKERTCRRLRRATSPLARSTVCQYVTHTATALNRSLVHSRASIRA
jgi:hypothetical protein